MSRRITLFDTTLRDGGQTQGVDFTLSDKIAIAKALDEFGLAYIEGGWPGANPTDDAFFREDHQFNQAKFTAFGMTRRPGRSAANDPGLQAVLQSKAQAICLVGKSWGYQVEIALNTDKQSNLEMIADSMKAILDPNTPHFISGREALFDAEHFFDGYKADRDYALACLKAAYDSGARWIVLCDTNGGTLPHEISQIVNDVQSLIPGSHLGIHTHNDTENAVSNSIAAIEAGASMVQGTLNGLGERCGNANIISLIPTLALKMGYDIGISTEKLAQLPRLSRLLDERLNRAPDRHAPYVGAAAFAHKGGLHVSAVVKDPSCYEHIAPESVGNHRIIPVSDQSGRSNLLARFQDIGIDVDSKDPRINKILEEVKSREFGGYAYDGAEASFELLARRMMGTMPSYFKLISFRVIDERRYNALDELITLSEATIRIEVNGEVHAVVAEGNGPIDALNTALHKALNAKYPQLIDLQLVDYKVRILDPHSGTQANTRLLIETENKEGERWTTLGVSRNVIDASFAALSDSFTYHLMKCDQSSQK